MTKASRINMSAGRVDVQHDLRWLDYIAIGIVLAVMIARGLMMESLNDPTKIVPLPPGEVSAPLGPGPAAGLVLDALLVGASLLPTIRRYLRRESLNWRGGLIALLLLGIFSIISNFWSANRFDAIVSGAHLFAGATTAWTLAQTVNTWKRLRIVAAVLVGMLLCQVADGVWYLTSELPALQQRWVDDVDGTRTRVFAEQGWQEDDFPAIQYSKRIMIGSLAGSTNSANSYAAELVILGIVSTGLIIQRISRRDGWGWIVIPTIALLIAGPLVWRTESKAAMVSPIIAIVLLLAIRFAAAWMQRHRKLVLAVGILGFLLATGLLIAQGLRHGALGNLSMTIRWYYWSASAEMFSDHPVAGVGYANFGNYYTQYRLPIAAEEVQDPHNFIVRIATELGIVGLALLATWLLAFWWRMGDPVVEANEPPQDKASSPWGAIIVIPIIGLAINILAAVDFDQISAYIFLEIMQRLVYAAFFVVGGALVMMDSFASQKADERPAPWLLRSMVVAAGILLIHNLIDFSLFEPGVMSFFVVLLGSVLGMRRQATTAGRRSMTTAALVVQAILLVVGLITFVGPIVLAEDRMLAGDRAVQSRQFPSAVAHYQKASEAVAYNASYPARQAMALQYFRANPSAVIDAYEKAIAVDPRNTKHLRECGTYQALAARQPDKAVAYFDRAIALNPYDSALRLTIAEVYRDAGRPNLAAEQYRKAIELNDLFPPTEQERWTDAKRNTVVAELRSVEQKALPR